MRSSNNNKVWQVCLLTWPQTRHSTCRLLSWLLQRIAEWNGSAQSAVNQRASRQIMDSRRDWVAIGIGRAHVNIIASLRINNGLKCQRGTSSICFSAANPTTTARTTTKHLLPPIALYVCCTPPPLLVLYLYVSFKNKTQTELERTEQCDGIEGAQFEIFKQIRWVLKCFRKWNKSVTCVSVSLSSAPPSASSCTKACQL